MNTLLNGTKEHHTSLERGYVSRKNNDGILMPYKGKFGKGYKLYTSNLNSTRYCYVTYYIESNG